MNNVILYYFNITGSDFVLAKHLQSNFLLTSFHPFTHPPSFYWFFFEHRPRVLSHCIWPGATSGIIPSNICRVPLVHKVCATSHINHLKSLIDKDITPSMFKNYYV